MALNKVLLIGNVGADPDVRNLENNGKVANFRMATTDRYKDRNGEQKEITEWHAVVVFGKPAEFVENYVRKGSQLFIEGKLRSRAYTDKSGADRSITEIVAESVQAIGSRPMAAKPEEPAARPSAPARSSKPEPTDDPTDDIPF